MPEQIKKQLSDHSLILKNRKALTLTGVHDVLGFDEQNISVVTDYGTLVIKGSELHINKLDLESRDVCVDGSISSLQYISASPKSIKNKLFR